MENSEIICKLVEAQIQLKFLHWQTKSYAKHQAYGNLYGDLNELIDDFVEAVDLVIGNDKRTPGEIINASSGVQHSNATVLEVFRKITGLQGNIELVNKFTTPLIWNADITLIKEKYNWSPRYSLEDGIRKFLEEATYE